MAKKKGSKVKSKKQVAYLLSNGSPLSEKQKGKLKKELHSGKVTVGAGRKRDKRGVRMLD